MPTRSPPYGNHSVTRIVTAALMVAILPASVFAQTTTPLVAVPPLAVGYQVTLPGGIPVTISRTPLRPAAVSPVLTGWRIGAEIGYSQVNSRVDFSTARDRGLIRPDDASAGTAQVRLLGGYVRAWGPWVAGLEADWTLQRSEWNAPLLRTGPDAAANRIRDRSTHAFGVTARVGYVVNPNIMPWFSVGGEMAKTALLLGGTTREQWTPGLRVGMGVDFVLSDRHGLLGRISLERTAYMNRSLAGSETDISRTSVRLGVIRQISF